MTIVLQRKKLDLRGGPFVLIQAEHDKIRENKPAGEKLTWEEYKSMTFTQHVITESIRMSTPLNLLMREAKEDVKIYSKLLALHKS